MLGNLLIAIRVRDLADREAEAQELIAKEAERNHIEAKNKEDRRCYSTTWKSGQKMSSRRRCFMESLEYQGICSRYAENQ